MRASSLPWKVHIVRQIRSQHCIGFGPGMELLIHEATPGASTGSASSSSIMLHHQGDASTCHVL